MPCHCLCGMPLCTEYRPHPWLTNSSCMPSEVDHLQLATWQQLVTHCMLVHCPVAVLHRNIHMVRSREHSVSVSGVSQHGTCGSHHYQTFLWYVLQGPVKSATHKPLLHDHIARSHPRHRRRAARVSAVTTDNRKKNQTVLSKTIKKTKYHFQIPHTNTTPKESRLGQIPGKYREIYHTAWPWSRRLDVKLKARRKARFLDAEARRLDVTCGCDDAPSHKARRKWEPRRLDAASTARCCLDELDAAPV